MVDAHEARGGEVMSEIYERTAAAALVQIGVSTEVAERLDPGVFATPALAQVVRACVEVREAGGDLIPSAIIERMLAAGTGQGAERMVRTLYAHRVPEDWSWDVAIAKLRDAHRRRIRMRLVTKAQRAVEDGDDTVLRTSAEGLLAALDSDEDRAYRIGGRNELLDALSEEIRARLSTPPMRIGEDLRPLARHFTAGSLITVGGDSGSGKSTFGLWLGRAWFGARGRPIGVVSLEDPWSTWADRWQGYVTEVSLLDSDYESDIERRALSDTLERLERVNGDGLLPDYLRIADMHSPSVADVMRAMSEHVRDGCTLLCVDYVQCIEGMGQDADDGAARELSRIVGALKRHAKHLGVPLMLMSQFNRGKRVGEEAVMSDMKGSSTLEQASEAIVLLWRATADETSPTLGKVAKLKSSARRPRFQLVRNRAGVVIDTTPPEEKKDGSASDFERFRGKR